MRPITAVPLVSGTLSLALIVFVLLDIQWSTHKQYSAALSPAALNLIFTILFWVIEGASVILFCISSWMRGRLRISLIADASILLLGLLLSAFFTLSGEGFGLLFIGYLQAGFVPLLLFIGVGAVRLTGTVFGKLPHRRRDRARHEVIRAQERVEEVQAELDPVNLAKGAPLIPHTPPRGAATGRAKDGLGYELDQARRDLSSAQDRFGSSPESDPCTSPSQATLWISFGLLAGGLALILLWSESIAMTKKYLSIWYWLVLFSSQYAYQAAIITIIPVFLVGVVAWFGAQSLRLRFVGIFGYDPASQIRVAAYILRLAPSFCANIILFTTDDTTQFGLFLSLGNWVPVLAWHWFGPVFSWIAVLCATAALLGGGPERVEREVIVWLNRQHRKKRKSPTPSTWFPPEVDDPPPSPQPTPQPVKPAKKKKKKETKPSTLPPFPGNALFQSLVPPNPDIAFASFTDLSLSSESTLIYETGIATEFPSIDAVFTHTIPAAEWYKLLFLSYCREENKGQTEWDRARPYAELLTYIWAYDHETVQKRRQHLADHVVVAYLLERRLFLGAQVKIDVLETYMSSPIGLFDGARDAALSALPQQLFIDFLTDFRVKQAAAVPTKRVVKLKEMPALPFSDATSEVTESIVSEDADTKQQQLGAARQGHYDAMLRSGIVVEKQGRIRWSRRFLKLSDDGQCLQWAKQKMMPLSYIQRVELGPNAESFSVVVGRGKVLKFRSSQRSVRGGNEENTLWCLALQSVIM